MRIFARNVVLAKSRFWYFMKRLNKAKQMLKALVYTYEYHMTIPKSNLVQSGDCNERTPEKKTYRTFIRNLKGCNLFFEVGL